METRDGLTVLADDAASVRIVPSNDRCCLYFEHSNHKTVPTLFRGCTTDLSFLSVWGWLMVVGVCFCMYLCAYEFLVV